MKITRMHTLAAALAAGAAAVAAGTSVALGGGESEESAIHACRHPNGGWVPPAAGGRWTDVVGSGLQPTVSGRFRLPGPHGCVTVFPGVWARIGHLEPSREADRRGAFGLYDREQTGSTPIWRTPSAHSRLLRARPRPSPKGRALTPMPGFFPSSVAGNVLPRVVREVSEL
jgi:hypothetical protein